MRKNFTLFLLSTLVILLVTSCAHTVPIQTCVEGTKVYGLWHGMICPITFIGSLFNHDVTIYAINNNGAWYNFGFVIGIGGLSSSKTVVSSYGKYS